MVGISGSFGVPARSEVAQVATAESAGYPMVTLLSVFVTEGNFMRLEPIGVGVNANEVDQYLKLWLSLPGNKQRYAGRKQITRVPYVGQL